MLGHAGLLTGGVAGVAFLASCASGLAFGLLFFVRSLPCFLLAAFAVLPPMQVAQSVVGAVAIGAILALNHRPGRYLGV